MNKSELIQRVSDQEKMEKADIRSIVDAVFETIEYGLNRDGEVSLQKFGTMHLSIHKERKGYHPNSRKPMVIGRRAGVYFRASPSMAERLLKKHDEEAVGN